MSDKSEGDRQEEAAHRDDYGEGDTLETVPIEDLQIESLERSLVQQ